MVNVGDEAVNSNDDLNLGMDYAEPAVVRFKTLHISSPILAAKSPFFYKVDIHMSSLYCLLSSAKNMILSNILIYLLQLFSNGMRESELRHVTLRINASGI